MVYKYTNELEQKVFEYLDELRKNGDSMLIVTPRMQDEFPGISRNEAIDLLHKWMHTYNVRHPKKRKQHS